MFLVSSSPCSPVQFPSSTVLLLWTWWPACSQSVSCGTSCSGPTQRRPSCSWSNSQRYRAPPTALLMHSCLNDPLTLRTAAAAAAAGCVQDRGELLSHPEGARQAAVWKLRPGQRHQHGERVQIFIFKSDPLSKKTNTQWLCRRPPAAVRCGQRPGAPPLGADAAAHAAQLDGTSRPNPKRDRGEPVQQHAAPAAAAGAERPRSRDPIRSGHSREKGVLKKYKYLCYGT